MFDLTILDYAYIIIVLGSTIWATVRGGVYETVATLSWVVAAIAARFLSPLLDGLLQSWFSLTESTIATLVTSYFLVFFVILVGFGLINQKLRDRIQESMMKVTDHTLGVIFGIIRGIILMGLVYWGALWYYSDSHQLPDYVAKSRTRPIMQLTAIKFNDWFLPSDNKLLERDMQGSKESIDIYNNLINPAVKSKKDDIDLDGNDTEIRPEKEMGYKSDERTALENQLLQIENTAKAQKKAEDLETKKETEVLKTQTEQDTKKRQINQDKIDALQDKAELEKKLLEYGSEIRTP